MNIEPQTKKKIIKILASVASSFLVGAAYKLGKKVDAAIDDHYDSSPSEAKTEQDN